MRLKHIHIDGFGKLSQFDLDLDAGFQVIYGNNEQGKSTLLQFIRAMFYGVADRKTGDPLRSRHRYKPWQGGTWGGTILFEYDGRAYRLTRRFGEAKAQDQIRLSYANTGEILSCPWEVQQQPGEYYFGLTQSAFQASAFLGQLADERTVIDQDGSVAARLHSLAGSLDETVSVQTLFNRFEQAEKDLSRPRGKSGRLDDLRLQLQEHNENEARYCADEQEADELLLAWESLQQRYREQVLQRQTFQEEREKLLSLSDRHRALQEQRDTVQALKRFQSRSQELENQLLCLNTTPHSVGQDLQTLRLNQHLAREIQQEEQIVQDKKREWLERKRLCEEKIIALDFAKENGVYPWEIYQQKQLEYAQAEEKLKQYQQLAQAHELCQKEKLSLAALQNEKTILESDQAALQKSIAIATDSLNEKKSTVEVELKLAKEREQKVFAEEAHLLERRQFRNQELIQRKAKYNRHLQFLSTLMLTFVVLAVLSFGLAYGLFPSGFIRQIGLVIGLAFLTAGASLAVHRSIFPAAEPTLITEPDAEVRLNELRAQKAAQDEVLAVCLAEQKEKEEAIQNFKFEQVQIGVRIEENQKNIDHQSAVCSQRQITFELLEEKFNLTLTDEERTQKLKAQAEQLSSLLAWRTIFLQKHSLVDDQALLAWKTNCELEERQLSLLLQQEVALEEQAVSVNHRRQALVSSWQSKYAYLLQVPDFKGKDNAESGSEADTDTVTDTDTATDPDIATSTETFAQMGTSADTSPTTATEPTTPARPDIVSDTAWEQWLDLLQKYEQKLVQTMEGYRHTTALYRQMVAEQGGKTWLQLEQERNRSYAEYLTQLQTLPALHALWEHYDDKKQFFKDQQVSCARKLEESYLNESDLKENMQEISSQRRQLLQNIPTDRERSAEKSYLTEEIAKQEAYLAALRQGRAWLQIAADDLANSIAPALNERAGKYLKELTQGAHHEVYVAGNMEMHLGGEVSSPLQREKLFSAGTQEQSYLALRLSLADMMSGEDHSSGATKLPLFCDDPFVNYDQERLVAAYCLFAKLGREGRQILLATCHPKPEHPKLEALGVRWKEIGSAVGRG